MSGIITGPYFNEFFYSPSAVDLGTMVAVLEIGAFGLLLGLLLTRTAFKLTYLVTSVAAGRVGDLIGRKMTLFWGAVIFTVGGAIQTFTTGFYVMVLGRIVAGFGVGLLSYVAFVHASLLQRLKSELNQNNCPHLPERNFSPQSRMPHIFIPCTNSKYDSQRGALACMEFTGNVFGYATSVVSLLRFSQQYMLLNLLVYSGRTMRAHSLTLTFLGDCLCRSSA